MLYSTLCYIEKNGKYLMLHRVKKENDANVTNGSVYSFVKNYIPFV